MKMAWDAEKTVPRLFNSTGKQYFTLREGDYVEAG